MSSRRKWMCLDCGVDTGKIGEHYMLIDATWKLIHSSAFGMLCIGCLETRLKRYLTASDFNSSHVNRVGAGQSKSIRLIARLTTKCPTSQQ